MIARFIFIYLIYSGYGFVLYLHGSLHLRYFCKIGMLNGFRLDIISAGGGITSLLVLLDAS